MKKKNKLKRIKEINKMNKLNKVNKQNEEVAPKSVEPTKVTPKSDKGLYLTDKLEKDGVTEFEQKNLIISPTGSGKSHFIKNVLVNRYKGKKLMLVSTTSLKESFSNEENIHTSQDFRRKKLEITDKTIHIMTYSEFGVKMFADEQFGRQFSVVFCDEIHSLFDYFSKHKSYNLAMAIHTLFNEYGNPYCPEAFYFTATIEKIHKFIDDMKRDVLSLVNIIDYSKDPEIYKNRECITIKYTCDEELELALGNEEQLDKLDKQGQVSVNKTPGLEPSLEYFAEMKEKGKKGILFNERIKGFSKFKEQLEEQGLVTQSLWSKNNKDYPMNEEQLEVYDSILEKGVIPEKYDFIFFNEALREGWNLVDENLEVVVLNTLDETNKIQSRGRCRRDISLLIELVEDVNPEDLNTTISRRLDELKIAEENLGKNLTREDTDAICERINVKRAGGHLVKWTTVKNILREKGYEVTSKKTFINGKRVTVSIITKKDNNGSNNNGSKKQENSVEKEDLNKQDNLVKTENLNRMEGLTDTERLHLQLDIMSKSLSNSCDKTSKPSYKKEGRFSKFLKKIKDKGFETLNDGWLTVYLKGKGKGVAFKHIKDAYQRNVIQDGREEEDFMTALFRVARQNKLFTDKNLFGITRPKKLTAAQQEKEDREREELIQYIIANS